MEKKTHRDILKQLADEKPELERLFKVRSLALFGSYAREEQEEDSDVDILVEVDPSLGLGFVSLARRLEDLLGIPVDLVSRRAIKPRNWKFIEAELIHV